MCNAGALKIDLGSAAEEESSYSWDLGDAYFAAMDGNGPKKGGVRCRVTLRKHGGGFLADIGVEGAVTVPCDRCLGDMEQEITGSARLEVELSDRDFSDGETILVDSREGVLDLSWAVYETIVLAVPPVHVHPEGLCDGDMLRRLGLLRGRGRGADPRWKGLEKLKNQEE